MNKHRWIKMITCGMMTVLLTLCLSSCGVFEDVVVEDESEMIDSDLIVVGFSQLGSESMWRTAHTASIQNALTKEDGFFLIYNNARQKQENQIKAVRSFISQRVDYIVFSPSAEEGWETVLQEAKDAGIPVILVDRTVSVADVSLYTTWIGANARQEGENAGLWLEEEMSREKGDVNIVVLQGTEGSSVRLGRTKGFQSIAEKHGNWHILEQQNGDFTTAKAKEVMKILLAKYPDIDVVVSQNDDMTFGAIEAMDEAGLSYGADGDIKVISFDAVHEALEMVRDGKINVDIECNPEQGAKVAEIIKRLERGEKVGKSYPIDEKVFTRENVEDYLDSRTY